MNKKDIFKGLYPEDPTKQVMWFSCLCWSITQKIYLEQFKKETGIYYNSPKNEFEARIAIQTGITEEYLKKFAKWMNKTLWGEHNQ